MKLFVVIILSLVVIGCTRSQGQSMSEIPGKSIDRTQLEEMFANIGENTDWDISGDLLWGYFFTHNAPSLLEISKNKLMSRGYQFVDIYLSDKDNPSDPDVYWLHVEKNEHHSAESLDKRNDELYLFAHELGLDSYDGMDVGPVKVVH